MTIRIQKISNITAEGTHTHKNCKPVLCITTGEIYASLTDAAEAHNMAATHLSWVITKNVTTRKGLKFCFVSNVMEHLEEIAECNRIREAKVVAYDEVMAKQNAIREAKEKIEKHTARYNELYAELQNEGKLLEDAKAELRALKEEG